MSFNIKRPWTQQPQYSYRLDFANRLARGVVNAIIPGFDAATANTGIQSGSNPQSVVTALKGRAYTHPTTDGVGAQFGASRWVTSDGSGTGDFSIALLANPASRAGRTIVFGALSGAAPETYVTFNGTVPDANDAGKLALYWSNAGNHGIVTNNNVIDGNWHLFSFSRTSGVLSVYVDGKLQAATTTGGTASIYRSATIYVGGYSVSGYGLVGDKLSLAIFANRAWASGEHASLAANPWQIFAPQQIIIPTATAGGGSFITLSNATYVPGSITNVGFRPRVTAS
jgi:hypothetical protein